MTPLNEIASTIFWIDRASNYLQFGKVFVASKCKEEPRLYFYNYENSKMPAYLIYAIFKATFGNKWIEEFEKMHHNRKNIWKVESFFHSNGMKEYRLYTMAENKPICSSAIIITENKVNTFSISLADVAPLLRNIIADYPPVFFPRYRNNQSTYCFQKHSCCDNYFFTMLPASIKKQREETQKIKVDKEILLYGAFQAGDTSGIIETIEALKCLEVLLV